jgi:hypothetical protein
MQHLLDHLLGIIRPIDPRRWPQAIRGMRIAEGWVPPMTLIAMFAVLIFIGHGVGLIGGNFIVKVFNYVAIATWLIVGLASNVVVTFDGMNNLRRLGFCGIRTPRWSFEVSRMAWLILVFAGLSAILLSFLGGARLEPAGNALFKFVTPLYAAFFVSGTAGYIVSAVTGRRPRGRAFECMQYFYWIFGIIGSLVGLAIWVPARAGWAEPMTVIACIIGAALLGILIVSIAKPTNGRPIYARDGAVRQWKTGTSDRTRPRRKVCASMHGRPTQQRHPADRLGMRKGMLDVIEWT